MNFELIVNNKIECECNRAVNLHLSKPEVAKKFLIRLTMLIDEVKDEGVKRIVYYWGQWFSYSEALELKKFLDNVINKSG